MRISNSCNRYIFKCNTECNSDKLHYSLYICDEIYHRAFTFRLNANWPVLSEETGQKCLMINNQIRISSIAKWE